VAFFYGSQYLQYGTLSGYSVTNLSGTNLFATSM
jgi:hypothetical protein